MESFAKLFGSLLAFIYHCFDRIVILGHLPHDQSEKEILRSGPQEPKCPTAPALRGTPRPPHPSPPRQWEFLRHPAPKMTPD